MSTPINSTQQQDRVAQQKLANARQHASAQGQSQGAAFSQLLSLACDEDTDLDALKQRGGLDPLGAEEGETQTGASGKGRRKTGTGDTTTGDTPAADTLHPSAQANAVLLALLERAGQGLPAETPATSGSSTPAADGDAATDANTAAVASAGSTRPLTETPSNTLPVNTSTTTSANTSASPSTDQQTDPPAGDLATETTHSPSPPPGKAVRDLARQLSALHADQGQGHTSTDTPRGLGAAWGRPASDATPASVHASWARSDETTPTGPQSWHMQVAGQPGSRWQTESNTPSDTAADDLTTAPTDRPVTLAQTGTDGGGQAQTGLGGEALTGTDNSSPATQDTQADPGELWQQQWSEAMEQVAQQVSYWVGHSGMRQATLRVGSGQQQAMDVKLSIKNGKAEIEFRTNHENARTAIAEGGAEVLRDLLAHSGIDLGSVSVGGQAAGSDDPSPPNTPMVWGRGSAGAAEAGPAMTELRPRSPSSAGLDVYV